MSGMSDGWLAEIRANLPDPSADLSRRERDSHALLAHVDHLTADNARLEDEVDARKTGQRGGEWVDPEGDYWRDYWRDRALEAEEHGRVYRNFRSATETAYALLNPPTEGENDEPV